MNTTQLYMVNNWTGSELTQRVLTKDQRKEFIKFLQVIKSDFEYFCVIDGIFRMRSNNSLCILETEFEYLKDLSICIEDTKSLHKKLSKFDKESDFIISVGSDLVYFSDKYQTARFDNVISQWSEHQFVTEEAANHNIKSLLTADRVFLKEIISKKLVNNIKKVTQKIKTNKITVGPQADAPHSGYLLVSNDTAGNSPSFDKVEYIIKLKNDFLIPLGDWSYFHVTNLPIIFNKSDMVLNCYLTENKMVMITFSTVIDGLFIKLYGRSPFIVENEE